MRKLEDLGKIADQINDNEDPQEEEEANGRDTNSDSGIGPDGLEYPDNDTSSEKDNNEEEDKVKPCPNCGKVHPIQNVFFKPNPFGFLVKFKLVSKENKDEETDEEKEEKKEGEME